MAFSSPSNCCSPSTFAGRCRVTTKYRFGSSASELHQAGGRKRGSCFNNVSIMVLPTKKIRSSVIPARRIKDLEGKLSNAQIIDPKLLDADGRCVFGATVDLEDQESGSAVTYQIVGEDEADIKHGKVSFGSPMARALIGKYAGDIAQVQAPVGLREYEIIDVRYE